MPTRNEGQRSKPERVHFAILDDTEEPKPKKKSKMNPKNIAPKGEDVILPKQKKK